MYFYADLHIHSKYSRATSKSCNLEELAIWAQKKGLSVISTGDFTHPAWFAEIQEKLVPDNNGAYRLKPEIEKQIGLKTPIRFILSVEISTIYKKGDKTRKVHHVVFAPDMEIAQNFRQKLGAIGNIKSDGRPILGLDSRDLLEITLESGDGTYIIPAHIWTPWFSVLGSKSGFDSIEECYADLSDHIFAVETGLSSDPEMNWRVSKLDKFRLVSNSDAHSPSKLAREATIFDTEPDYFSIMNALKTGSGYVGTVEFFPEEGKYHEDGHRKCNICFSPQETIKHNGICPVCGKPLTIGVLNRVNELADRPFDSTFKPATSGKVVSLVPLPEMLSEIMQVGVQSKSVCAEYERLVQKFGSELSILTQVPVEEISKDSPMLAEGISRLRVNKVIRHPGYDGEYGVIRLFEEDEILKKNSVNLKLDIKIPETQKTQPAKENKYSVNTQEFVFEKTHSTSSSKESKPKKASLDEFQQAAVENPCNQLLIIAGPGSGKTTVLTRRISYLIKDKNISAKNCLAITFTRRASLEMRERLQKLLNAQSDEINIHTFHSMCLEILKENYEKAGLSQDFGVITPQEKSLYKQDEIPDNLIEFDDLINLTVKLFEDYPEINQVYKERFKYIFVDEYQDIDEKQYKLIKLLADKDANLCAIGDPNQAIYGFRGGDSKFFNNFSQDYPNVNIINLKNNYRCAKSIVEASNQLIKSDNIIARNLSSKERITIHTAPTDKAEAEFMVSTIENLIGGNSFFSMDSQRADGQMADFSFGDFAILYRTSAQLKPIVEALERSGMPFVKLSDDMLCDNKSVRKLLKQLNDTEPVIVQLERLCPDFKEEIEDYTIKYLKEHAMAFPERKTFIHEISLLKQSDTLDQRADRIALMTLHSSKGLEFPCVFVTGLEDGIVPLYRAQSVQEREEERRLLYVGMTRAKQRLFLTRALKRNWLGSLKNLEISPFLERIEKELIEFSRFEKAQKQNGPNVADDASQLSLFN